MTLRATTVYVRPDGPYIVTGDFALNARAAPHDDASVVLCRCGQSSNQPYCDGTHTRIGFVDAGVLPADTGTADTADGGRLTITPTPNGPLKCAGPLTVSGPMAERAAATTCTFAAAAVPRPSPSADGTHRRRDFVG